MSLKLSIITQIAFLQLCTWGQSLTLDPPRDWGALFRGRINHRARGMHCASHLFGVVRSFLTREVYDLINVIKDNRSMIILNQKAS